MTLASENSLTGITSGGSMSGSEEGHVTHVTAAPAAEAPRQRPGRRGGGNGPAPPDGGHPQRRRRGSGGTGPSIYHTRDGVPGGRDHVPVGGEPGGRRGQSSSFGMRRYIGTEKSTARLIWPKPVSRTRPRNSRASSSSVKAK